MIKGGKKNIKKDLWNNIISNCVNKNNLLLVEKRGKVCLKK